MAESWAFGVVAGHIEAGLVAGLKAGGNPHTLWEFCTSCQPGHDAPQEATSLEI
jgi:hypothetical protein